MRKGTKITYWLLVLAVASVVLHNFVYFLTKKEEGFFFAFTFIFLVAFIVSLFYNLLYSLAKKKDNDSSHKK